MSDLGGSDLGVVIVGAGQAGLQAAASLREAGFAGPVTLLGEEPGLPYQRPPLSKAYLAGKTDAEGLALRPQSFFSEHRIAYRAGARAVTIDRPARRLTLGDGGTLAYDHLVLATGARNRALPAPGAGLPGVYQLRSLADADRLKAAMEAATRVVIVGAGFIGLEFASVCAARGLSVTVVEAAERPMARAVSEATAAFLRGAHEAAGIRFILGAGVSAVSEERGRACAARLSDGASLPADLILIGIGVVPNQEAAAEAGLPVSDGIHVDAFLATADRAISAIGDCARFPSRFARGLTQGGLAHGDLVRIESVQNAVDHARCVAARLVGRPAAYDAVPWFWSDQGGHKLQIAGLTSPSDLSVRRETAGGLSVFRFRDGRLSGVETVSRAADHMAARRILSQGLALTPEEAADPRHDLKALATGGPKT